MSSSYENEIEYEFKKISNKKIYKYKIGNFQFNIYTSLKIKLFFNEINPNIDLKEKIIINIYLENNLKLMKNFLKYCDENKDKEFVPIELEYFYKKINEKLTYKHNIANHINKYYKIGNDILAIFPYVSDNFLLKYNELNNDIYIIGNNENLNRIILDFLSVSRTMLPLHASSVARNDTAIVLISDSCGGKTSILVKLLEIGYDFLSDDSMFFEKSGVYRVSNSLYFRRKFPNNYKFSEIAKKNEKEKIHVDMEKASTEFGFGLAEKASKLKVYVLKKDKTVCRIENMKQPFPCIDKQSFWCIKYIEKNYEKYITDIIDKSIAEGNKLLERGKEIIINFDELDKVIENIR